MKEGCDLLLLWFVVVCFLLILILINTNTTRDLLHVYTFFFSVCCVKRENSKKNKISFFFFSFSCPLAVGFGLSTRAHVKAIGKIADGAIIGSAVIKALAAGDDTASTVASVSQYVYSVTHDE